ncbi:MAG TPA: hypothetical protein VFS11_10770 [Gemmatimonadales bacterium]|nr:hypothetical protein [Gemmatimonadales bacterium]
MNQRTLLAAGAVVGGVLAARRFLPTEGRSQARGRMMERMMDRLPPNSPPRLVMSALPRLQQQNDEIIALLREQNDLLRRQSPEMAGGRGV